MRKIKRIVLLTCSVFCLSSAVWAQNTKPFVIPELKEWKGGDGQFVPTAASRNCMYLGRGGAAPCSRGLCS